jgi:pimeloyl-ACP methyl ester carboxylesterase
MVKLVTEYVDLGDARIAYRQYGAGPTLLLLHGNSESKRAFYKYQTVHFPMFHTIAVDSRGHGESVSNDQEYTISQYAEDVIALCKVKKITEAYVIGYSDGGNIALHLASKAPRTFTRIVAISPNYLVSGTTDRALKWIRAIAKMLVLFGKLGMPTKKAVMRFNLMLTDIGITAEELGRIQTSLRILYAEHDLIKEEHIQEMGRLIPDASVQKIGHSNHLTIFYKQDTIDSIREFLRGEEAGREADPAG